MAKLQSTKIIKTSIVLSVLVLNFIGVLLVGYVSLATTWDNHVQIADQQTRFMQAFSKSTKQESDLPKKIATQSDQTKHFAQEIRQATTAVAQLEQWLAKWEQEVTKLVDQYRNALKAVGLTNINFTKPSQS